ncbi:MAG: helix-turn-helix domain-containing protein [Pseudonocardiaceae bacterium]
MRGGLSRLRTGRRIAGEEREQIAARVQDRYAQGATIRELMEPTGRSYGWGTSDAPRCRGGAAQP